MQICSQNEKVSSKTEIKTSSNFSENKNFLPKLRLLPYRFPSGLISFPSIPVLFFFYAKPRLLSNGQLFNIQRFLAPKLPTNQKIQRPFPQPKFVSNAYFILNARINIQDLKLVQPFALVHLLFFSSSLQGKLQERVQFFPWFQN